MSLSALYISALLTVARADSWAGRKYENEQAAGGALYVCRVGALNLVDPPKTIGGPYPVPNEKERERD
jgi:hypothetical protein